MLKYRITSVDEERNTFVVYYFDDQYPAQHVGLNITIEKHDATPEEIEAFIASKCPYSMFEAMESVRVQKAVSTTLPHLKTLLDKERPLQPKPEAPARKALTDEEIDQLLAALPVSP